MNRSDRRTAVRRWLDAGLAAVDPELLTASALTPRSEAAVTVIAIGKAAPGMCRGAVRALGPVTGVCVTNAPAPVPEGIELFIGDHPLPRERSLAAGRRVLEVARAARGRCIALISGGGSALCELPVPGIGLELLQRAGAALLDGGASIEEINLVRSHLSAIKGGGLARAVSGALETWVISDVGPAGPEVVASGPTIPRPRNPERVLEILDVYGIPLSPEERAAIARPGEVAARGGPVTVLADGRTAAEAVVGAARAEGVEARVDSTWLDGSVEDCLRNFLRREGPGVTVAAGEPDVKVETPGVGGRNSHAALLAAIELAGSEAIFAAFATDGVDGRSEGAGAIVDGSTVERGGDPEPSLARCDSAAYLEATGDLIRTGPTGTNVADLWVLWQP
jgi:hydroxypyruvate reductase